MPKRVVLIALCLLTGCALRYHDPETGAEHIWGVGHVVVRRADSRGGQRAVVQRTDTIGVSVGRVPGETYVSVGLDRRDRVVVADDATVCLQFPHGSMLDVRVGREWPANGNESEAECR